MSPARQPVLQRRCACGGAPGPTGECAKCKRKRLQRSAVGAGPAVAPPIVEDVLRSPGRELEPAVRGEMEARFGHDFSRVRVHTDGGAAESARAVNANAYTMGNDVVFGAGRYTPTTPGGRRLLAHELAHTVQQRGATTEGAPIAPDSAPEAAAASAGRAVASGRAVSEPLGSSALALARDEAEERAKAVKEAEALIASWEVDEEDEAVEAALLKVAETAPDPRFQPGGFTDEDIYGATDATLRAIDEELAPAKDPRPFKVRFEEAREEAAKRPYLPYDEGGSHESIWRYGKSKGLFAERERKLVADTLLAPYAEKAERSRKQWEIQQYNAQINRFRNFRAQLNLGFIQGALLGRPGVPPIIRGAYFSYGVAHTSVEAYRGYQADDPSRVVGALLPLAAGYGFHRIAGMGEPPIPVPPGGLPIPVRVLSPGRGKPVEVNANEVLAAYATEPALVKKMGSDAWAQTMWELQGGDGGHPMAWKHPNQRVVYVNETRWTGKISEINQPRDLVTAPPTGGTQAVPQAGPQIVAMRPGTITVDMSIQRGLVAPGGRGELILRAIEREVEVSRPTNLNDAVNAIDRAAKNVGFSKGNPRPQTTAEEIVIDNAKGVVTTVRRNGEIIVTDKDGQVLLHLMSAPATAGGRGQTSPPRQGAAEEAVPETIFDEPTNPIPKGAEVGEQVGDFRIYGEKGLKGTAFEREIWGIKSVQTGSTARGVRPLHELFAALKAEASAHGATELRIIGRVIRNENILKLGPYIRQKQGGTFRELGGGAVEIVIPLSTGAGK